VILAERREDPRQQLGRLGEAVAAETLERAGMRIVARRFRLRTGEIDLVAERGDLVVFVEVKARRGVRYGSPAEAVTAVKQRRMARAALTFLSRTGRLERRTRFDVVEVHVDEGGVRKVRHIEDAFRLDRDPY
jgi:putative endonuclease